MAVERDESDVRTPAAPKDAKEVSAKENDPVLDAFAELVGDLSLDLSRATLGPALQGMHEEWRSEASQLRRDTAEWVSRVNTSRQHMEQVVERQHELAQEVYKTHSKLLQDMAEFQKERTDQLQWQAEVSAGLARLGDLQQALSVETTRIGGVVRDIISELARFQADLEKRYDLFESKLADMLSETLEDMQEQLQETSANTEQAMETLSKTNEETRVVLGRDLNALRRELQEVATRLGRDVADNRGALQQRIDRHTDRLDEHLSLVSNKVLGFLIFGEIAILGTLGYLISRLY